MAYAVGGRLLRAASCFLVVVAVVVGLLVVPAAQATFPGRDGRLALGIAFYEQSRIAAIRADGSRRRWLTPATGPGFGDGTAWAPSWSADGRRLLFSYGVRFFTATGFGLMRADGSKPILVPISTPARQRGAMSTTAVEDPSFAPDGRHFAYTRIVYSQDPEIWIATIDGRENRMLEIGEEPSWSPDGRLIAFRDRKLGRVCLTSVTSGRRIRCLGYGESPDWSPDGRHVAYSNGGSLFVVGANGRGTRRLGSTSRWESRPVWSPSGKRIAYVVTYEPDESSSLDSLWIIDLRRGVHRRILRPRPSTEEALVSLSLAWQPAPRPR